MRASSISIRRGRVGVVIALTTAVILVTPARATAQDEPASGLMAETAATYVIDVEGAAVEVTFAYAFTNTTTDAAFTGFFESLPVAAVDVAAEAAGRELSLEPASVTDGFTLWSVEFRTTLDPGEAIEVDLTWRLPADPTGEVVVAAGAIAFEVFAGGTPGAEQGAVVVEAPAGFEVVSADAFGVADSDDLVTLFRGDAVPYEPTRIVLERPDALVRVESGSSALVVLADWAPSTGWRVEVDAALAEAIPVLDAWFDERTEPLEIRRRGGGGDHDGSLGLDGASPYVAVGADGDRAELIHQLAHAWLADVDIDEPWFVEGLADAVAGTGSQDRAAAVVAVLADQIGVDGVRRVVETLRTRSISYPGAGELPQTLAPDWRTLLDVMEQVGGADAEALFRAEVVDSGDLAALDRRAAARVDYLALEERAGDWAVPPLLRVPMAAWDFDTFGTRQGAVSDTLLARDLLAVELTEAELAPGVIAESAFESAETDMAEVDAILARQTEALEALLEARRLVEGDRGLLAWIGLLGDDPDAELEAVIDAWDAGQFEQVIHDAHALTDRVDGAVGRGTIRVVVPALLVIALVAGARNWQRRRRNRTPPPAQADEGS